jgi:hypothetical protein
MPDESVDQRAAGYEYRACCDHCKRVFHAYGAVRYGQRCPHCIPPRSVNIHRFYWLSTAIWWQPWTWFDGKLVRSTNDEAYTPSPY